jgi:hypothetical protein
MKKNHSVIKGMSVLCLVSLGFFQSARAQLGPPFSGTISFDGVATLNAPIGSATHFTSIFGISGPATKPQVIYAPTGDYTTVPVSTPVTFNLFTFGPQISSASTDFTLWSFSMGATNYSFEVTSETNLSESCMFLNIAGTGTAYVDGFSYSNATWEITETGNGPNLTFGASTTIPAIPQTPVPEPPAFALLSALLPGYLIFRRRQNSFPKGQ